MLHRAVWQMFIGVSEFRTTSIIRAINFYQTVGRDMPAHPMKYYGLSTKIIAYSLQLGYNEWGRWGENGFNPY
jgi:hypothetical protein